MLLASRGSKAQWESLRRLKQTERQQKTKTFVYQSKHVSLVCVLLRYKQLKELLTHYNDNFAKSFNNSRFTGTTITSHYNHSSKTCQIHTSLTFSSPDRSGLLFSSLLNFCFFAGMMSFPASAWASDIFPLILSGLTAGNQARNAAKTDSPAYSQTHT